VRVSTEFEFRPVEVNVYALTMNHLNKFVKFGVNSGVNTELNT